ncbi:MAG TPA: histidine phosphatase family protein [Anaerolineales bacterium]|nr:histidine phosphatase family protein [Anaerolineales bacterium]
MSQHINLFLVRHARSAWNAQGRLQGHADSSLDDVGIAQARALAEVLRKQRIHAFYTSPAQRARQTAQILANYHQQQYQASLQVDERLRERDVGAVTGLTWSEVQAQYGDWAKQVEKDGWEIAPPPGGEDPRAVQERMVTALDGIIKANKYLNVLVISHRGSLNIYLRHLFKMPLLCNVRFNLENTSVTEVEIRENRIQVLQLGNVQHLSRVENK